MPKGTPERTHARRDEIINAACTLYETMGFKEITIREIGKATSFSRPSIYNYFQTKEEIFLAILEREYASWEEELVRLYGAYEQLTVDGFARALAESLKDRSRMLKILSMNHYDMESASRMENLIRFKTVYGRTLTAVGRLVEKFFPEMKEDDRQAFLYAFFPFLFGVYPYTQVTEKQQEAMEKAGVGFVIFSTEEIIYSFVKNFLGSCLLKK